MRATLMLFACCVWQMTAAGLSVSGRIVDVNGLPLPGVRITARHFAEAPVATSSDAAGLFQLAIPAEADYSVKAEHDGFFVFQSNIDLRADAPLEIRLNRLTEMAETVDVSYSPPTIDPAQTEETKRIHAPEILNVPRPASQDFRNALPMMPGAVQATEGQVHFNGGGTDETTYRLNGFNMSEPATGTLTARLNIDAIQTMEFQASRTSSAAAKGSAGSLEIRTQMGDNHWRTSAANIIPGFSTRGGLYLNHWSPRASIAGPLRRDRVWFHDAFDMYYVADVVTELPGEQRTNNVTGSNLTGFQWNLSDRQIVTANFLVNLGRARRTGLSFLNPAETTVNGKQSLFLGSLKDQLLWGRGLLEFGFAQTSAYYHTAPQGTLPYVITPFGTRGNFVRDESRRSDRQEWLINAVFSPMERWGTHQFGAGVNVERDQLNELVLRHGLSVVRVDDSLVRDVQFLGAPRQFRTSVDTFGYVNDKWSATPELTVEAGVHYQWGVYTKGTRPAPTLAASWAPKALGGTKIAAGWGIYFDTVPLRTLALDQEQTSITTFYSAGLVGTTPLVSRFVFDPAQVRRPRFAIASLSVERVLPGQIYGRLSLASREGKDGAMFTQRLIGTDNEYLLQNIARPRYRAAEVSLSRTFRARYQWFAAYTRSAARSTAVLSYSIEDPLIAAQTGGPLAWDTPNRAIAWGWAPVGGQWLPRPLRAFVGETDFQLFTEYRTGFPFTATTENGRLAGAPNSIRFPDYCSVNIALERRFPFRGYIWAFRAGLVNALGRQNPNVVNSDFDSPRFGEFGGGQSRALNVRLRFVGRK